MMHSNHKNFIGRHPAANHCFSGAHSTRPATRGFRKVLIALLPFAMSSLLNAAGPEISNLTVDDITQTTARVSFNTSVIGPTTTLQTNMTAASPNSGGVIALADASAFPNSGTIQIGAERIAYFGRNGNNITLITDPSRGREGTGASPHAIGDTVQYVQNEFRICYKEPGGSYANRKSVSHIGYGLVKPQSNFHVARISGLIPATQYTYKVRTRLFSWTGGAFDPIPCTATLGENDTESPEATFTTQDATDINPIAPAPVSINTDAMPAVTGTTYNVPAGDCNNSSTGLQASINAAAAQDANLVHLIAIPPGTTCSGRYKLTRKTGPNSNNGTGGGSGWIIIRSAADDSLLPPPGVRINETYVDAGLLPRLESTQIEASTIYLEDYTAGYWLSTLDIGFDSTTDVLQRSGYSFPVYLRDTTMTGDFVAKQPRRIVLDRNVIGGSWRNVYWTKGCIFYRGVDIVIRDNYCHNINTPPSLESGGLQSDEGSGPYLLHNNFIEGGTENIFFGDNGEGNESFVPRDITITRNYATKPVSYKTNDPSFASQTQLPTTGVSNTNPIQLTFATVHDVRSGAGGADGLGHYAPTQVIVSGATGDCAGLNATFTATRVNKFAISVPFDGSAVDCTGQMLTVSYGKGSQQKNLIELKTGQRVLIRGNIFDKVWAGNPTYVGTPQGGCAVVLTTRGPFTYGGWPASLAAASTSQQYLRAVQSVDFQWNRVTNAACGFSISGYDDTALSGAAGRFRIENNLVYNINPSSWADTSGIGNSGYGELIRAMNGVENLIIRHNTFWGDYLYGVYSRYAYMSGLFFDANIIRWGQSGFQIETANGQSGGYGLGTRPYDPTCAGNIIYPPWSQFNTSNYSFTRNIIVADSRHGTGDPLGYGYGRGRFGTVCNNPDNSDLTNNYWAVAGLGYEAHVRWVDPANGDFRLSPSSPFRSGVSRVAASVTGGDSQLSGQGPAHDGAAVGLPSQDVLEAELGKRDIPVLTVGSNQAALKYTAPDGAPCFVDASPNPRFTVITTRAGDGGGRRSRTNVVGGLAPNTLYYWRLDCKGAGYTGPTTGSFTTMAPGSAVNVPFSLKPPANSSIANAMLEYGATPALGSSTAASCSGSCTLTVPATSRQALFYRVTYRDAADSPVVVGALRSLIP